MQDNSHAIAALGNEPPLVGDGRSGPPDRREVSARWLSGTFLTGITSSVLLGVALFAALDGREQLATPPEIANVYDMAPSDGAAKTARVISPRTVAKARDRRRLEVSTLQKVGDRDVVRTLPFVQVSMALAAGHTTTRQYPPFNPLEVFAEDAASARPAVSQGLIYGAKVESEVSLRTVDFDVASASFDERSELSADEVEDVVRQTAAILTDGAVRVAALHYIDPERFGASLATQTLGTSYGVRIVQENVSVAARQFGPLAGGEFAEDIIPFTTDMELAAAFAASGYAAEDTAGMVEALAKLTGRAELPTGSVLRVGLEVHDEASRIVRCSIYDGTRHVLTVAVNDRGQFVPGDAPEPNPAVLTAFDATPAVHVRGDLPNAYDGIFRAAYSYGLDRRLTRQLIKLLASDVDFQSRLNPSDRLQVFFSNPNSDDSASDMSELLYVSATFGGATRDFYRFEMDDGAVDYFDKEGRSARQFLLRSPVPNGRFNNGFGMRRHPILGYSRMHTGVDWTAPTGTPIIAAGNGVVQSAGWSSGYGRQTLIRHANGYVTSYNHQSAFAEGIVEGARVRQGQVIGFVGSSGMATGAHLHYELLVNGTKVDPMRVRLPVSRVLKDAELTRFQDERSRIDELLKQEDEGAFKLAGVIR